eukprot:TRINITY_DN23017_c0_g1_i1.p1 TRINITY_DN23017_c0_g1~~TRINITY_DN23017_c0_g1_i1.p1  ORF type:complete len:374 (-),score=75.78 TRINITY_DN23017_c0_g1_i1:23-1144(-)
MVASPFLPFAMEPGASETSAACARAPRVTFADAATTDAGAGAADDAARNANATPGASTDASAVASTGASAGFSACPSAGASTGTGAGIAAGASLGGSASASAGVSASASAGAGAGADASANASANASAAACAGVGASTGGGGTGESSAAAAAVAPAAKAAARGAGAPANSAIVTLKMQILDGSGLERRIIVRLPPTAVVGDIKRCVFAEEIARGWQPKLVSRGRALANGDSVSGLPTDAYLQCYLLRPQTNTATPAPWTARGRLRNREEAEQDLFMSWAGLGSLELWTQEPSCAGEEDLAFHAFLALVFAVAWGAYFLDALSFDPFSRMALKLFSLAWAVVFVADLRRPGRPRRAQATTEQGRPDRVDAPAAS